MLFMLFMLFFVSVGIGRVGVEVDRVRVRRVSVIRLVLAVHRTCSFMLVT